MISQRETQGSIILDAQAGGGMNYIDLPIIEIKYLQHEYIVQVKRQNAYVTIASVVCGPNRAEQQLFIVGAYDGVDVMAKLGSRVLG